MKRTFTFTDTKSHKFWDIEVNGTGFTVTYGAIGTKGREQTKEFDTEERAQAEAEKLTRQKVKKGYHETTASGDQGPERAAFEEAILENPEDTATYAAYADFLMEHDDPQGELIQVQLALEDESLNAKERKAYQKREKELLKKHEAEWVGEWADLVQPARPEGRGQLQFSTPEHSFRRGILHQITIGELNAKAAKALVESKQTRLVQELRIGGIPWEELDEAETATLPPMPEGIDEDYPAHAYLPRWPYWKNLRVVQLGWTSDEVYDDFCDFQCHESADYLHKVIQHMPRLEELYLFVHGINMHALFQLRLANLRILQIYHSWGYPLTRLAQNPSVTKLTHLLCHPHALEYGDSPYIQLQDLQGICRSKYLHNLTHLRLRCATFGDEGCKELVESGMLSRLKMLDLRHGCISDNGLKILLSSPYLKQLDHLDLSRNELTANGIKDLNKLGISVDTAHQHASTKDLPVEDHEYLMEADYE